MLSHMAETVKASKCSFEVVVMEGRLSCLLVTGKARLFRLSSYLTITILSSQAFVGLGILPEEH